MVLHWLTGFGLSVLIAGLAWKKRSLDFSGFLAALVVGTWIYGFGGWVLFATLMAFFITSSLWTKMHEKHANVVKTHHGRSWKQVLANSFASFVCVFIYNLTDQGFFLIAAVVAIASSNADTWASELGPLSKGRTVFVTTWKDAPKGSSGAVSLLGTAVSFLGALFIALVYALLDFWQNGFQPGGFVLALLLPTIGGFAGGLFDSYLGALAQAKYRGVVSGLIVESKHLLEEAVVLISGFPFVNNDMVNLLSGVFAALFATLLFPF